MITKFIKMEFSSTYEGTESEEDLIILFRTGRYPDSTDFVGYNPVTNEIICIKNLKGYVMPFKASSEEEAARIAWRFWECNNF